MIVISTRFQLEPISNLSYGSSTKSFNIPIVDKKMFGVDTRVIEDRIQVAMRKQVVKQELKGEKRG
jgi:hypothetical protein